jgi:hypothetical protein
MSSWLKLPREAERGSDGGTEARVRAGGDVSPTDELGRRDAGGPGVRLSGDESAMLASRYRNFARDAQVGSIMARTFMPGS